jgi:hypothetical protein
MDGGGRAAGKGISSAQIYLLFHMGGGMLLKNMLQPILQGGEDENTDEAPAVLGCISAGGQRGAGGY